MYSADERLPLFGHSVPIDTITARVLQICLVEHNNSHPGLKAHRSDIYAQ
jgi:hypothetical protein